MAHANISDIQFENYTLGNSEGLAQNIIVDIVEDKNHFLWLATEGGLVRYDGYEFKSYLSTPQNPNGIPDKIIIHLNIDDQQNLWVVTNNGVYQYNENKDNFRAFNKNNSPLNAGGNTALAPDNLNSMLIADPNGLYRTDISNHKIDQIEYTGEELPPGMYVAFAEQDKVWFGSRGHGIFVLDKQSLKLYSLSNDENPWHLKINTSYLFDLKKINDEYWLATEAGVYVVDNNFAIEKSFNVNTTPSLIYDVVRTIEVGPDNDVWLGTENGLTIINTKQNTSFSIDHSLQKLVSLQNPHILKIFKDHNQSIWVSTFGGGLHKYNPRSAAIRHYRAIKDIDISLSSDVVWGFAESDKGDIWVATQNGGIDLFNSKDGVFEHYLQNFGGNIWDIAVDKHDHIWLATDKGIWVYQYKNKKLIPLKNLYANSLIANIHLFNGRIWLGSSDGVVTSIDTSNFNSENYPINDSSIKTVSPLLLDSTNNLWLSTDLGLFQLNIETGLLNRIVLQTDSPQFNTLVEGENYFWLSTTQNEILKLDKKTFKQERQHKLEQLLNGDYIMSMERQGDAIWISTRQTVSRISLKTGQVDYHVPKELLNKNDINEGALLATSNNMVLLGGTRGIWVVYPELDVKKAPEKSPAPIFTDFLLFNKPASYNKLIARSKKPVAQTSLLKLNNTDSPFSLKFAVINAINPSLMEYRYQMLGLSDQWLTADNKIRQATFTNLDFGSYKLRVQAREPNGLWSDSRELEIQIAAPVWLNRYALIAYAVFSFLLFIYWLRQYHIKRTAQIRLKESEERLKMTLWSSGDELWDWDIGKNEIVRSNTWGTLDFPMDNQRFLINDKTQSNIHKNDIARVQKAIKAHLRKHSEYYEVTYRVKDKNDNWIWLLDRGKVVAWNDLQPLRMAGTFKNISHLKQAEEQLHLFKRSVETISDGVFITDKNFNFISVNQAYCNITGETKAQALASTLTFHQYPPAFTTQIKQSLFQKHNWLGEVESVRTNGERYEIELNIDAIYDEDNQISHFVGVFSDITARKQTEKELLKLANSDTLTELPNRSFFQATLKNLVRKNIDHVLICLDMDNFKKINDSLGHQTGDKLIKHIAVRLQQLVGPSETCYRLGGDEFSILIENETDIHRVTRLAQKILSEMSRPFTLNRQEFVLGCSIGIAFFPNDGATPQELLKNSDTAMYFAKNAGGNKYQFFSGEMNQNAVRQLQIETLIRHGLKEDLFSVFYQPKVNVASGELVSMEALVRFEHPEKGVISPNQFIPLAEDTGQIIEIGERVLVKACTDTKYWVDKGMFNGRVAINLSARQFELVDLDERIEAVLKKTGLSARHLELEITEGTLMQNPEQALKLMQRLREMGIHLALDDFGTGYSSLAYLKKFPLNTLKIDKAFIDDIVTSEIDRHMTSAIITIAHNLGLNVVAEGVEDEKQLAILRRYQCEMIQGYLYSRPLNKDRFSTLLSESHKMKKLIKHQI
ncbi:EAL domain-containing protein [Neptunicella marina]|uniref:cyclic-guanylate-specific phosphodiesterase n=1 Tax=Neptunicella marina TaxID=2125989 RepID=A0A8J6IUS5_9ALTE|nr:EAL domain-containing protein [Neptunicella marina]MBC3766724.1 EAL domain-containing protein [Neptunicella marina]